jgi:hypothetical protein
MTETISHTAWTWLSARRRARIIRRLSRGEVTWPDGRLEIYILPHPCIERMGFHDTMDRMDHIRHSSPMSSELYVEAVAYQLAAVQELERRAFAVTALHPIKDKRARLHVAARYIKNGTVKFPRQGCERLLQQILGGGERFDDGPTRRLTLYWALLRLVWRRRSSTTYNCPENASKICSFAGSQKPAERGDGHAQISCAPWFPGIHSCYSILPRARKSSRTMQSR